jgi:hypothetical protein
VVVLPSTTRRAKPGRAIHAGEQLPWLRLDDGLPRFQTTGYDSEPLP